MNNYGIITLLILIVALFAAGCTTDPGNIDTGQLAGEVSESLTGAASELEELSGQFTGDQQQASGSAGTGALTTDTGDEWILWNVDDTEIDLAKGGYSYFRPNLNGVLFKDLKIEIDMDDNARVDLRIVNDEELQEYLKNWDDYYVHKTATSFDRDAIGMRSGGASQWTEETHSSEGMILILEPTDDQPGTGTIKIYYPK